MRRVFIGLASGVLLVLGAAFCVGLFVDGPGRFVQHFALGLLGCLLATLVHVVVFTYFTVTGKAIRQAVALADLQPSALREVRSHKKVIGGCVVIGFLPLVLTVALGAQALRDPAAANLHTAAAAFAIAGNAIAMFVQLRRIGRNDVLLSQVMAQYRCKGPTPLVPDAVDGFSAPTG